MAKPGPNPQVGGSYIVASEELGRIPGLMAAAGLPIDHVMTVAVSIASAWRPPPAGREPAGAHQARAVFAVPAYAFILLPSVTSAAIYVVFRGNTESLLPLYAVGVFLAFTLSQGGHQVHCRSPGRRRPHRVESP